MRDNATKENVFFNLVKEDLIKMFWEWQDYWPEQVDPAFQIFDSVDDAIEKQKENRLTDKLNEEIKEYIDTEK